MERKIIIWRFQTAGRQKNIYENMNMAIKRKP